MPRLAAFPKAFLDALCIDGTMTIRQWIELGSTLGVEGLEFYSGFRELAHDASIVLYRRMAEDRGLRIPMFCCSPDFTHPEPAFRRRQIDLERRWIDMTADLGGSYCRVLTGQRRPEISREDGLACCVECISECLAHAEGTPVTLVIENHYKDNYWRYPEFAQQADLFCELLERIGSDRLAVNYDPSNALLAGEDPLVLLRRIKHRVATMHASDRYLAEGTIDDLRREESVEGYAKRLRHGEIGRGLNDYDAIFAELRSAGFDGWISIEDGVDGMDQLHRSVAFVKGKMHEHWTDCSARC